MAKFNGQSLMGKVAAIQMTSSHVVADNLAAAGELLREAKDAGADIACLPENFSFIGLRDADKLQVAEADGEGAVQSFLSDTARELKLWILGGTIVIRARRGSPRRQLVAADRCRRQAGGALRQDSFVRCHHPRPRRAIPRIDACHSGTRDRHRRYAGGQARALGVLRHAISRTLPRARVAGRRVAGDARRIHGADRARALGDAAASAGHRKPVLRGGAGAEPAPIPADARPMAIRSSSITGARCCRASPRVAE